MASPIRHMFRHRELSVAARADLESFWEKRGSDERRQMQSRRETIEDVTELMNYG